MMRVLFIDPPDLFLKGQGHTRQVQPLGLACVGAFLRKDHDVRFLLPDTRAYTGQDPWGEIRRAIEDEAPDVVGITAVTAMMPSAARVAQLIKSIDPSIWVVLGGTHITSDPIRSLEQVPWIDFGVCGEGEEAFADLLRALEASDRGAANSTAGVVWRNEDGAVRFNPSRPAIEDLDALPFPMRDNLVWSEDILPGFYQAMITLRGCPYRCIYCAVPSYSNRKTRYRSPSNVVDEIAMLRARYGISYLFFHDSVFTLNRKRSIEIAREMIDRDQIIPFACQTRADRVDDELLDLLQESGCHQIFFGIESGDVQSLKKIRKKMRVETIREAVAKVKARGIRCTGFFMVGFPWEDETLIRKTADFACDLELDAVSLFSATPLPGTELWDMAGGDHLPDSIDFTTPQVNLTGLQPAVYQALFEDVKEQINRYNIDRMHRALQNHAHAQTIRRNWLDG